MKRIFVANTPLETIIEETTQVLRAGGLVLFPTETVYGAGVDATNPAGVEKLLTYKSRREGKPLSIAVANPEMAEKYVEINSQARILYQQFLPGPLTIVSKGKGIVAPGVESEFGTLGIRIPAYPMLLKLLKVYGSPITATSANASGKKRPYTVDDALSELSPKQLSLIDLILDAGQLPPNEPSTVIDTTLSTPLTMRTGSVAITTKAAVQDFYSASEEETQALAGKLLLKHWETAKKSGIVIGLDGSLGAGKTIFAKGIAHFLNISETLTSPTYTYIEEYDYNRHGIKGKLFHLDLWKIGSADEFERLEIDTILQPTSIILIEWWSQVAQWCVPLLVSKNIPLITVTLEDKADGRSIKISESDEK